MANRRTQKTQRELKNAFVDLLSKKRIEKIRVNEVAELAEVSRATFYLHFEDIYGIYDSVKNDILIDLWKIFNKEDKSNSENVFIEIIENSINYIDENMSLFRAMTLNGNILDSMLKGMNEIYLEEFYPTEKTDYGIAEVNFVAWGLMGTINDWVKGDLNIPKDYLIKIIRHIVARFI
ncbi:MAG: TetR/AcrR family transcriptional regulator [Clostridia bacterium]